MWHHRADPSNALRFSLCVQPCLAAASVPYQTAHCDIGFVISLNRPLLENRTNISSVFSVWSNLKCVHNSFLLVFSFVVVFTCDATARRPDRNKCILCDGFLNGWAILYCLLAIFDGNDRKPSSYGFNNSEPGVFWLESVMLQGCTSVTIRVKVVTGKYKCFYFLN